jgi:exosortase K
MKRLILQNAIFYMLTLLTLYGLKYHYSQAGSEDLKWILTPTAAMVQGVSGIRFEHEAHTGYVNREHRVIIAPACAGVNFLIIAFGMAAFVGLHHCSGLRRKLMWLAVCAAAAYALALVANTFRVVISIHLYQAAFYNEWITPERVHRMAGAMIYFFFQCLFYFIIHKVIHAFPSEASARDRAETAGRASGRKSILLLRQGLAPLGWYLSVALAVPLLNAAFRNHSSRFGEHCAMVIAVCLMVWVSLFLVRLGWRKVHSESTVRLKKA